MKLVREQLLDLEVALEGITEMVCNIAGAGNTEQGKKEEKIKTSELPGFMVGSDTAEKLIPETPPPITRRETTVRFSSPLATSIYHDNNNHGEEEVKEDEGKVEVVSELSTSCCDLGEDKSCGIVSSSRRTESFR